MYLPRDPMPDEDFNITLILMSRYPDVLYDPGKQE